MQPHSTEQTSEPWRASLEKTVGNYLKDHYKYGVSSVYGSSGSGNITLIVCIESHQYQPQNFWYTYFSLTPTCIHLFLAFTPFIEVSNNNTT